MSLLHASPIRWIAGGVVALIVTIYSALMLGLNVPAVRAVPLAPWAEGGFGADSHPSEAASTKNPAPAAAGTPARVAGVRVPAAPETPHGDDAFTPLAPTHADPTVPPAAPVRPLPAVPPLPVPALSVAALDSLQG